MWDIIGHERVVTALEAWRREDRMPHALLFVGAAGVGKQHLALELAAALNCTSENPPCGQCVHCRQIRAGTHPDVSVIERAEGKDTIQIGQVRAMREDASLRAFQGRRKVYIIAGAESLTLQAADALLKTLEEPPGQVTIILTAPEIEALPETVVSRCRALALGPVDVASIAERLQREGLDEAQAEKLARLSEGMPGWALRAARQPKLVAQQEELVERLSGVLEMDLESRLLLAESLAADRKDRQAIRRAVELMALLARDLLLAVEGLEPRFAGNQEAEIIRRQAGRFSVEQVQGYLHGLRRAMDRIDGNVDPRLALEALFTALP